MTFTKNAKDLYAHFQCHPKEFLLIPFDEDSELGMLGIVAILINYYAKQKDNDGSEWVSLNERDFKTIDRQTKRTGLNRLLGKEWIDIREEDNQTWVRLTTERFFNKRYYQR